MILSQNNENCLFLPYNLKSVISDQYPAPSTQHPAPSTQHTVPSTQHPVPSTQHPAPSTQYPVPSTQYPLTLQSYLLPLTSYLLPLSRLITHTRTVSLAVAAEHTVSMFVTGIDKLKHKSAILKYYTPVEVYKMGVVCRIALCAADTVRIMTGIAWCLLVIDMFLVIPKRGI